MVYCSGQQVIPISIYICLKGKEILLLTCSRLVTWESRLVLPGEVVVVLAVLAELLVLHGLLVALALAVARVGRRHLDWMCWGIEGIYGVVCLVCWF